MRIDLTIAAASGRHDVAVVAAAPLALARVAPAITACVGAGPGASLWAGPRRLGPAAVLGDAGLRTGDEVSVGRPGRDRARAGARSVSFVAGPHAGVRIPLYRERLVIGRDPECTVVLDDDRMSRRHAELSTTGPTVTLRDLGSTNGTTVEGEPCTDGAAPLGTTDLARLGDCLLRLDADPELRARTRGRDGALAVSRSPREAARATPDAITLPVREQHSRPRRVQWVTALLPAAAGGLIAWLADSPQFLLFALLSPLMLLSGAFGDRLHWRRRRRTDAAAHRCAAAAARARVDHALQAETQARRRSCPDPPTVLRIATTPGRRLWERRRTDPDLLRVRIASADRPSAVRVREGSEQRSAGLLRSVPVEVELRAGALGLTGPPQVVRGLARWVVAQLATSQSPNDVEIHLLLSPESAESWRWARWLPHVRTVATEPSAWAATIGALAERGDGGGSLSRSQWRGRWAVLVADLDRAVASIPGVDALLADGPRCGITAVWVGPGRAGLPSACHAIAGLEDPSGTRVQLTTADGVAADTVGEALAERVDEGWADQLARALAPLVDDDTDDNAVPTRCGRLETFGLSRPDTEAVAASWATSDGGARTAIGRTAEGPLVVDLASDGPHLLVAGTTGAGKSELLRTLVAGLAVAHPPDDLSFLLVDYKGGAAFADCIDLPHTTGVVTDLDETLTERALRSLHAELRRRERLFVDAGAADLPSYRRTRPAVPVPRLVIVVDEFATLVEELPAFVPGLVGVAQRGRSLGVHLVLATQRPGAAVSADIRANTSLRIALRTTDVGDSIEVLDVPDAAHIDAATPGRAWLRCGTRLTAFQTAHDAGSGATDGPVVEPLDGWRRPLRRDRPGHAELVELVAAVRDAAVDGGRARPRPAWLPPLPELVRLGPLDDDRADPARVRVGIVDRPDEQGQPALIVRVADGESVLVVGRAGSGRTNALLAVAVAAAARRGPQELEIYLVDADATGLAARLSGLQQVCTAVSPVENALLPTLLARLRDTRSPAHRLLLVDGWDRLATGETDFDAARLHDALLALLRTPGLTVAVTGDRSVLVPRFASHFTRRLLLTLADANDYALAGVSGRLRATAEWPPGRGVCADDGALFQFARVEDDDVRAVAAHLTADVARPEAVRLQPLPQRVSLRDLRSVWPRNGMLLGVAGDDATPCHADLVRHRARLLVAGAPRSGRSTVLCTLLHEARRLGLAVVVAASARSPLDRLADTNDGRAGRTTSRRVRPSDPADALGEPPDEPTLLLVDDSETFVDSAVGERLVTWARDPDASLAVAVAGRCDDLLTTYRGVAAEVRRYRCGVLLRPTPMDGELLGIRLPRPAPGGPPGRGLVVGDPVWGAPFDAGEPLTLQVATTEEAA